MGRASTGMGQTMDTSLRTATHHGVPVLHVGGELDVYAAGKVGRELARLVGSGKPGAVVVDLTGVTFIDSAGMGALAAARRAVQRLGGRLSLVVDRDAVLRALRLSSLAALFPIYGDLTTAVSSDPWWSQGDSNP